MSEIKPYTIIAYYHFASISDPHEEVQIHKRFFENRDASSRIYISENGINGQMCISNKDAAAYMEWIHSRPEFAQVKFKLDLYHEHIFPRLTIKYRKHLVAVDESVDMSECGEHVSPEQWKMMLEQDDGHVVLDIRNDYEWSIGHFEGAEQPPCETFRDFEKYTQELKNKIDRKKTPVMMYCTGGIRCELFSAMLKEGGFEKVYQLDGGVINYGHKEGNAHWLGKLFVFDDRLAVPISDEPNAIIGKCYHCGTANDNYYNCANMDCNHLFLCCPDCLKQHAGCCTDECMSSKRLRPYHHQNAHKPFRKWYHYWKEKEQTRIQNSEEGTIGQL